MRRHQRPMRQVRPHTNTISSSAWVEGRMSDLRQTLVVRQWQIGLNAVRHFHACYPQVYTQHVAGWPLLPGTLVRVCESFLGLAAQEVDMQYGVELPDLALCDPLLHLYDPLAMPEDLSHLMNLEYDLAVPHPKCFGVGLQMFFDEGLHEPRLGTMAIWRMLQRTDWSVGIDLADVMDSWRATNDEATPLNAERLMSLIPIPANTPVERLVEHLKLSGWIEQRVRPGHVIAYAVERTDNPLANCVNDAPQARNYYEWPFIWDDLPSMADWQDDAERLHDVYMSWCDRVAADPATELRKLERAMHKAATAVGGYNRVRVKPDLPKTLIDILGDMPEEVML